MLGIRGAGCAEVWSRVYGCGGGGKVGVKWLGATTHGLTLRARATESGHGLGGRAWVAEARLRFKEMV